MKKTSVLLVDDHVLLMDAMAAMLSTYPYIEIVGQAENGTKALTLVKQNQPDVVLLDLQMPDQDGSTLIPKIREISPKTHILVLTSYAETERIYQAIKKGALGYLVKDAKREQLMQAIRDVSEGRPSLPPSIAVRLIYDINHPSEVLYTANPLTPRELETLKLIAHGLSNQEIAKKLVVHERTVAKHVSSILDKLHLANRTQAALYALREGITGLNDDLDNDPDDKK